MRRVALERLFEQTKVASATRSAFVEAEIAKQPNVPRQILKDIPRPPNSASRDD